MNKKGITLVELIAVLAILAILAVTAVPVINNVLLDSKNDTKKVQENNIKEASENYLTDNIGDTISFSNDNNTAEVTLQQLVDGGYISGDLTDPKTKASYNLQTSKVQITKNNNNYTYNVILNTN